MTAFGVALLIGAGLAAPAQAAYTVTLPQVGSNVVATGSGTIDLVLRRIQRVQERGRVWRGWHLRIGSRQTVLGEHCARQDKR